MLRLPGLATKMTMELRTLYVSYSDSHFVFNHHPLLSGLVSPVGGVVGRYELCPLPPQVELVCAAVSGGAMWCRRYRRHQPRLLCAGLACCLLLSLMLSLDLLPARLTTSGRRPAPPPGRQTAATQETFTWNQVPGAYHIVTILTCLSLRKTGNIQYISDYGALRFCRFWQ